MDKPIRVMVAEDFPLLREDFCDVVSSQQDMEVVGAAATGDEIVALARSTLCDVILMDIEMETVDAGIRAEDDCRSEKLGYKIREAQMQKIPYMLVVGDRDMENGTVSVRTRKGEDLGAMTMDAFLSKCLSEIASKSKDI